MTAIITKNGTGVPPGEALQKGELAVDLDALKLYTSTDGSDVVEVSASDGADFTMDAYGTATTTITHEGEPMQVGVGHWVEEESYGDFTYWLKKEFFEEHSGTDFNDQIYHIVGAGYTFSWMGESCGAVYADFEELYGQEISGDTCVIGTAPMSAKRQRVLDTRAKHTGYEIPLADEAATDTPLVVYGKIQANDLVDADGNTLLGGSDFEMPEVIDGGTY